MLEKQIEKKVCEYASTKGMLVYKFTSPSRSSVPDRLFIAKHGRVFFCEFKAPGKKATAAQLREHYRLQRQGVQVFVIDNIADGKDMVDVMSWGSV